MNTLHKDVRASLHTFLGIICQVFVLSQTQLRERITHGCIQSVLGRNIMKDVLKRQIICVKHNMCQTVDPFINDKQECVQTETEIGSEIKELLPLVSAWSVAPSSYGSGSVSPDVSKAVQKKTQVVDVMSQWVCQYSTAGHTMGVSVQHSRTHNGRAW